MSTASILILALLLDAALGEPKWLWDRLPHPAVLMGRAVGFLDRHLNRNRYNFLAGIVSRDTAGMDESAVARSAIESAAENLSDGVIAPAFWFLVGGLPALMVYKIVNTADSMIAYRTPRYERFGKATAYADDALNLIPARLTCLLIALPSGVLGQWIGITRDAGKHRSPNAGWPEAAMARAINVALAGPRAYDGQMQDFPWVGGDGARTIGPAAIDAAIAKLWQAWGIMLGLVFLLALFGFL